MTSIAIGDQAARGLTASLDGMLADFAFVRDLLAPRGSEGAPLPAPAGSIQLRLTATGTIAPACLDGHFSDRRRPCAADGGTGRHRYRDQREVTTPGY